MKILVIQTAFIGDAILTLPMIQKLNELDSKTEIHVVSTPVSKEIFEASPSVKKVFPLDKRGKHKSIISLYKFAKLLKNEKYDKVFSPHRSFRTSLLIYFTGIKESTGFSNSAGKFVYKNLVKYNLNDHEVSRNLSLIGIKDEENLQKYLPVTNVSNKVKIKIRSEIEPIGNKEIIAIAPGSVWETKKYPLEKFEKIIQYLIDSNKNVILIGGKADSEICALLKNKFSQNVYDLSGKFSIVESIEILRSCKLLISNDSAPTHFGMCADIPVLTIYCSTVPDFGFYPYNGKSRFLSYDSLKCKPCGIHGHKKCPIGTFECAYKLDEKLIFATINEILNQATNSQNNKLN